MPPSTLVHQLAELAARQPDAPALHGKVDGRWVARMWGDFWHEARAVAKGLAELGHRPGDCVAIVGENRPEWVLLELGIMAAPKELAAGILQEAPVNGFSVSAATLRAAEWQALHAGLLKISPQKTQATQR